MIKIAPENDFRYRVHASTLMWVCEVREENGKWVNVEIVKGCERTIYHLEGRSGYYVQYNSRWVLLRNAKEFKILLSQARKGNVYLFSNELGVSVANPSTLKQIAIQPFIAVQKT
ncbi:hypothetical protein EAY24_20085 [Vibrio anguillarum]|uniref:Uncharacterized protein n=2 Tax=Vibrio TaxID=662 RepID=A0A9X4FAY3_9VIBR|nr:MULTISPECIES: hypothetical protein [Vibrio]ASG01661.1 hypothetical protein CEG15_16050 [Vibrio anguillarum]MBF4258801.1 hypothetical protein [Vibrio anguillarum]MBF4295587.1 hypothetical protein [Vibrio anguillarum]MBF4300870.1 hypothetical protein [Vibrio anguillarum]MBF4400170.1 hypothetical protein [Vibrio anguillarum]